MSHTTAKYFVRDWGRPCGIEPKVFTNYEEADKPNQSEDPSVGVSIMEFSSEEEALKFISD
jgi:hypothetical protein